MKDITSWTIGLCGEASPVVPAHACTTAVTQAVQEHVQYLQELAAESLGWQPLGAQAYLHLGAPQGAEVVHVVGIADVSLADHNVVLLHP